MNGTGEAAHREPGFRRHILVAGTRHYPDDPHLMELPGVDEDVERVAALFEGFGYTRILPHLSSAPRSQQLLGELEDWLGHPERCDRDVLVVYYAGHGMRPPRRHDHYLMCGGSRVERPQGTAIRSSDLAGIVTASPVGHALLILDTCHAGAGTAEMGAAALDLTALRGDDSEGLWLLASARAREEAVDHAFVSALEEAVRHSRAGMRQPHLDFLDITNRIDAYLHEHHPHQSARCHAAEVRTPPPFFPNPDHRPDLSPSLVDVQTAREWTAHFDPRSRGVEYASEKGDFFTGRHQALATLAGWLREPQHDGRARVVTGSPGSGKSALLGRLLTLSDPDATARSATPEYMVPPAGCVTTAVHARGTNLESLTSRLAAAVDIDADTPHQLLAELADRTTPHTVLIDALDEAGTGVSGTEPLRIARELLRPLTTLPRLRLIVGTRREALPALGSAVEVIDLDTEGYSRQADVEEYAYGILRTSGLSGRGHTADALRTIAAAVAARAGQSFLVARMTVRAVAHGDLTVDLTDPDWRKRLPTEAGQAFDAYLARYGTDEAKVRRLLTPLAYAEGDGLPWDSLWASLATALSGVPCSDDDIEWLFRYAGAYVVEVPSGDERSVFRLYHEALAEHLRNPRRDTENQRRLTETLLGAVPHHRGGERDWARAHPYVLRHLAGHAAAAGELARVLEDSFFLTHAEPDALLSAMDGSADPAVRRTRAMYRASAHLHKAFSGEQRAQLLAIDASRFGEEGHRRALRRGQGWSPRWATKAQTSNALRATLDSYSGSFSVMDCLTVEGVPLLVTSGPAQAVWLWDLRTESLHSSWDGHRADLSALCCAEVDGDPIVVTADMEGELRVWDIAEGTIRLRFSVPQPAGKRKRRRSGGGRVITTSAEDKADPDYVVSLAPTVLDGVPAVAGYGFNGTAWLWNLRTGDLIRQVDTAPSTLRVDSMIGCTELGGTAHAIVTSGDRPALAWNLLTGDLSRIHDRDTADVEVNWTGTVNGQLTGFLGERQDGLLHWDPATGKVRSLFPAHSSWVTAVAVVPRRTGDVVVVGHADGMIHLCDARSGSLLGRLSGHDQWVHALSTTVVEGSPVIVSSSSDGTLRLWDLPEETVSPTTGHTSQVHALTCLVADGMPIAVSGGDLSVRAWHLGTGVALGTGTGHSERIMSVAHTVLDGVPVAVTSGHDDSVRLWSLPRCEEVSTAPDLRREWNHVDTTRIEGVPAVLIGSEFTYRSSTPGGLVVRDASSLEALDGSGPLTAAFPTVTALACTTVGSRPTVVIAGRDDELRNTDRAAKPRVQVWDLTTMSRLGSFEGCSDHVVAIACTSVGGVPVALLATNQEGVQVWDMATFSLRCTLDMGRAWAHDLACAVLDGVPTAAAVGGNLLRLWDLTTTRLLHQHVLPHPANAVAFGPADELVVGSGYEVIVLERPGQNPGGSV
ncbi:caspase family protein [Streptomyces glomeratus]|uniref:Caspase family p20 domain-containing protein n=1 Tax=Streptomyces glomeratus TaxID=284452 RepID=A0ABP6LA69_9ACTN|nr:caspase family protein [Streptomyces glomeratus]MCF1507776.1 caspase family protein [Streptomyces glomeratus]